MCTCGSRIHNAFFFIVILDEAADLNPAAASAEVNAMISVNYPDTGEVVLRQQLNSWAFLAFADGRTVQEAAEYFQLWLAA